MTGRDMADLTIMFGASIVAFLGAVVFVIGLAISFFSFQWWIFAIAGVLFLISGIGWLMIKQSEKQYYANREECEIRGPIEKEIRIRKV